MRLDRELMEEALPGYEIGIELGRGAFGVVFEGRHKQLGRRVAIKQLPRAFGADPQVRSRFVAEARLLASLEHPHIVPIYDYVEKEGLCLLVMEKLTGGTVWERFSSEGVSMQEACAVVLAASAGLHHAHERGVLHRDVKPENLVFSENRTLKVTDFGIAKVLGGKETMATKAGQVLGTPAYMAPEQSRGGEVGPQVDQYATATMLYELLSGRLPFPDEDDVMAMLYRRVTDRPAPLSQAAAGVPASIAEVTMRALATSPEDRYVSLEEFAVALGEAATAAWGAGWATRAGVTVMAAGPIVRSLERPTGPGGASAAPAPPTVRRARPAGEAAASPDSGKGPAALSEAPGQQVRPEVNRRMGGAPAAVIDVEELVPVREVMQVPPPPRPQLAAAAGLLVAAAAFALFGLTPDPDGPQPPPGALQVAGAEPAFGAVGLDLSRPVTLSVRPPPPPAPPPASVTLSFSAGGVPLGTLKGPLENRAGRLEADLHAGPTRYMVAGPVRAKVRLAGAGPSEEMVFTAEPFQPWYLSIPAAAAIALTLFLLAYAESLLRHLRRGRRRWSGLAGMALIGALLGPVLVVAAWLLAGTEPAAVTAAVSGALGSAFGVAAALAAWRMAQRRRFRRKAA